MLKTLLLAFLLILCSASPALAAKEKESAYDRVMRTKTLRCGYIPYEPYLIKDPNTGALSGITVEYIDAIGKRLGLKVDWAGEVNIDQVVPALNGGRFDAFCVPCTPDHDWVNVLDFSGSLGALPYYVYVSQNSEMTKEQIETAKFAIVDGFVQTEITKQSFPNAQYQGLPQTTSPAEMYDQLKYGKADALVNEDISAMNYMKNNPGVIRRFSDKPMIAMKMFLVTPKGDEKMRDFFGRNFDTGTPENLSLVKDLLVKYKVPEGSFLLGDQCKKPTVTDKGWKICTQD